MRPEGLDATIAVSRQLEWPESISSWTCSMPLTVPHARHLNPLPLPSSFVGSGIWPDPVLTRNCTVFVSWSTVGSTQACFPFLVDNAHLLVSGISAPHAGFGQRMVRSHNQAITVASPPPRS